MQEKRYKILDIIGEGGMGIVYRAEDRLSGQVVALKRVTVDRDALIFTSATDSTQSHAVALANEFRTLASLRHVYIISVLDYGFDTDQRPFFTVVFSYCINIIINIDIKILKPYAHKY